MGRKKSDRTRRREELQADRDAPPARRSLGPTISRTDAAREGEEGGSGGGGVSVSALAHTHSVVAPCRQPSPVHAQRRSRRHVRETIALDSALEDGGRIIWQSCSGITVRFFQCRGHSQTVPRSARGGSDAARGADLTPHSPSSSDKDRCPPAAPRYGS